MALAYASVVFYRTLAFGDPVAGYPSMIIIILFLGAVQLIFIGVIGEYLGRMFNETKNRPLYLVNNFTAGESPTANGHESDPTGTGPSVDQPPQNKPRS